MKLSRQLCKGDAAVLMGNQIVVRLAGALQHKPVKIGGAGRVGGIAADQGIPVRQRGTCHAGIVHDAAVFLDLAAACRAGHRGAVAAAAHHGVDRVRHGNNARA